MPRHTLKQTLTQLHEAIAEGPEIREEDRSLLRQVLADIQQVLDEDSPHTGVAEQLQSTVLRFEQEHPSIAAGLHKVTELLRQL